MPSTSAAAFAAAFAARRYASCSLGTAPGASPNAARHRLPASSRVIKSQYGFDFARPRSTGAFADSDSPFLWVAEEGVGVDWCRGWVRLRVLAARADGWNESAKVP